MDPQQGFEENSKMQLLGEGSTSKNNITTNVDNATTIMNKDGVILLPDLITEGQINTPATNEANPSETKPSDDSSSDKYDSDTNFDECLFPDPELEEMQRKLAMYQDMYAKYYAKEGTTDHVERGSGDPSNETRQQKILLRSVNDLNRIFQDAMDDGEITGFVYCIYLEDGSILHGSSRNLSEWWGEHCRDYENGIVTAPEQNNSENHPVDPNPNDGLVVPSDNLSSIRYDANRRHAARIRKQHRQICAKRKAAGKSVPSPIFFSEATAFDGKNHFPMLMVQGSFSKRTVTPPSVSAAPPVGTSGEVLPAQDKKEDMLYLEANHCDYSPDEPAP